ncbi:MAG TPA: hypothetical protein PK556_11875 [Smithellaceae bacterium]|nr:hypothetical protein [Smithellaceae bacterium]
MHEFLGFYVPMKRVCAVHCAPMDYLWHAYRCDIAPGNPEQIQNSTKKNHGQAELDCATRQGHRQDAHVIDGGRDACASGTNGDCIVWANRGGGKTQLAAVATLLEGLFKPGCDTRILAGSLDQSRRTYEYLCGFVQEAFGAFLARPMLKGECRFSNGTSVQVLPQSMMAVRGRHIHKLRCDEIELFDEEVFNAAKYITHTRDGKLAAMEMLSTMHRPYGLMQKLVDNAAESGVPVFRWCLWETIEQCTPDRSCSRCALNSYCAGKARDGDGYLSIDDAIAQMRRSSKVGFESEVLCIRPNMEHAVFADFDPAVHVAAVGYDPMLSLYRTIDFGIRNPFVCLWIQVGGDRVFRVIDEYAVRGKRTIEHAAAIKVRTPGGEASVEATFCDPAGVSKEETSGSSSTEELRKAGIHVRFRTSKIMDGIEQIRAALKSGDGKSHMVIDPRCAVLIKSLTCYHFAAATSKTLPEVPEKDGEHDHAVDALRYFFINYRSGGGQARSIVY